MLLSIKINLKIYVFYLKIRLKKTPILRFFSAISMLIWNSPNLNYIYKTNLKKVRQNTFLCLVRYKDFHSKPSWLLDLIGICWKNTFLFRRECCSNNESTDLSIAVFRAKSSCFSSLYKFPCHNFINWGFLGFTAYIP